MLIASLVSLCFSMVRVSRELSNALWRILPQHSITFLREPSASRSFKQNTTKTSGEKLRTTEASGKTQPMCSARTFRLQKLQVKHGQNVWQGTSVHRSLRQDIAKMSGKKLRSTEVSSKTRPTCLARSIRLRKLQAKHDQNVWQEASVYRSFRQNTCRT